MREKSKTAVNQRQQNIASISKMLDNAEKNITDYVINKLGNFRHKGREIERICQAEFALAVLRAENLKNPVTKIKCLRKIKESMTRGWMGTSTLGNHLSFKGYDVDTEKDDLRETKKQPQESKESDSTLHKLLSDINNSKQYKDNKEPAIKILKKIAQLDIDKQAKKHLFEVWHKTFENFGDKINSEIKKPTYTLEAKKDEKAEFYFNQANGKRLKIPYDKFTDKKNNGKNLLRNLAELQRKSSFKSTKKRVIEIAKTYIKQNHSNIANAKRTEARYILKISDKEAKFYFIKDDGEYLEIPHTQFTDKENKGDNLLKKLHDFKSTEKRVTEIAEGSIKKSRSSSVRERRAYLKKIKKHSDKISFNLSSEQHKPLGKKLTELKKSSKKERTQKCITAIQTVAVAQANLDELLGTNDDVIDKRYRAWKIKTLQQELKRTHKNLKAYYQANERNEEKELSSLKPIITSRIEEKVGRFKRELDNDDKQVKQITACLKNINRQKYRHKKTIINLQDNLSQRHQLNSMKVRIENLLELKEQTKKYDLYLISKLDSAEIEKITGNAIILDNSNYAYFVINGKLIDKGRGYQTVKLKHRYDLEEAKSTRPTRQLRSNGNVNEAIISATVNGGYAHIIPPYITTLIRKPDFSHYESGKYSAEKTENWSLPQTGANKTYKDKINALNEIKNQEQIKFFSCKLIKKISNSLSELVLSTENLLPSKGAVNKDPKKFFSGELLDELQAKKVEILKLKKNASNLLTVIKDKYKPNLSWYERDHFTPVIEFLDNKIKLIDSYAAKLDTFITKIKPKYDEFDKCRKSNTRAIEEALKSIKDKTREDRLRKCMNFCTTSDNTLQKERVTHGRSPSNEHKYNRKNSAPTTHTIKTESKQKRPRSTTLSIIPSTGKTQEFKKSDLSADEKYNTAYAKLIKEHKKCAKNYDSHRKILRNLLRAIYPRETDVDTVNLLPANTKAAIKKCLQGKHFINPSSYIEIERYKDQGRAELKNNKPMNGRGTEIVKALKHKQLLDKLTAHACNRVKHKIKKEGKAFIDRLNDIELAFFAGHMEKEPSEGKLISNAIFTTHTKALKDRNKILECLQESIAELAGNWNGRKDFNQIKTLVQDLFPLMELKRNEIIFSTDHPNYKKNLFYVTQRDNNSNMDDMRNGEIRFYKKNDSWFFTVKKNAKSSKKFTVCEATIIYLLESSSPEELKNNQDIITWALIKRERGVDLAKRINAILKYQPNEKSNFRKELQEKLKQKLKEKLKNAKLLDNNGALKSTTEIRDASSKARKAIIETYHRPYHQKKLLIDCLKSILSDDQEDSLKSVDITKKEWNKARKSCKLLDSSFDELLDSDPSYEELINKINLLFKELKKNHGKMTKFIKHSIYLKQVLGGNDFRLAFPNHTFDSKEFIFTANKKENQTTLKPNAELKKSTSALASMWQCNGMLGNKSHKEKQFERESKQMRILSQLKKEYFRPNPATSQPTESEIEQKLVQVGPEITEAELKAFHSKIQERKIEIQQLERDSKEVMQLFIHMQKLVTDQGKLINQISSNLESTLGNTRQAHKYLQQAFQYMLFYKKNFGAAMSFVKEDAQRKEGPEAKSIAAKVFSAFIGKSDPSTIKDMTIDEILPAVSESASPTLTLR